MERERGSEPVIRLDSVSFRYPGASEDSLQGVSLSVSRGDFVAVAGSNGSGKSTLCKCFNGLIPKYYTGDMSGGIYINGESCNEQSVAALSRQVAYVFQDFENQLVRPTVLDEASFAPLNYGFADYRERGMKALAMLGLEGLRNQWIWQLSGGQKHLTALAGALSLDPDVIVVDEPVAQLDPAHARMIYEKLKELNEEYGKTIVVIEHHTEFIADYCRTMILMGSGGRLLWVKPVREGLASIGDLKAANIEPPQVTQAFCALAEAGAGESYPPVTLDQAEELWAGVRVLLPERQTLSDEGPTEAGAAFRPSASGSTAALVRFRGVACGYQDLKRNMKPVLDGIDLAIHEGERVALVGNNGAGKSTILRLISGIRRPWQGTVEVCGLNTREASPEKLSGQVAFLFQNPEEMFIADDIRKDVEYYLRARGMQDFDDFIEDIMLRFRLKELERRDGRLLSGGQQRRATLAIGMAMRPAVMLLDEPTASLDISSRREMVLLLDQLKDRVKAVVVATHDMQLVAEWANRVIVMHEGRIALDADSTTLFQREDILKRAALAIPQIGALGQRLGLSPVPLTVAEFVARMKNRGRKEEITHGFSEIGL